MREVQKQYEETGAVAPPAEAVAGAAAGPSAAAGAVAPVQAMAAAGPSASGVAPSSSVAAVGAASAEDLWSLRPTQRLPKKRKAPQQLLSDLLSDMSELELLDSMDLVAKKLAEKYGTTPPEAFRQLEMKRSMVAYTLLGATHFLAGQSSCSWCVSLFSLIVSQTSTQPVSNPPPMRRVPRSGAGRRQRTVIGEWHGVNSGGMGVACTWWDALHVLFWCCSCSFSQLGSRQVCRSICHARTGLAARSYVAW